MHERAKPIDVKGLTEPIRSGMSVSSASEGQVGKTTVDGRHKVVKFTGIRVGFASECGRRSKNDDYCVIGQRNDFFAISDGIGGAPYGDVISRIACNAAVEAYEKTSNLREAFDDANATATRTSKLLGENSGATLLVAKIDSATLHVLWAGDTIALLCREDRLSLVSRIDRVSTRSNALKKAVGYGPVEPDERKVSLLAGDRLLFCTDGVWETLDKVTLFNLLIAGENAPLLADDIVSNAARNGKDNATCIVVLVGKPTDGCSKTTRYREGCASATTPVNVDTNPSCWREAAQ